MTAAGLVTRARGTDDRRKVNALPSHPKGLSILAELDAPSLRVPGRTAWPHVGRPYPSASSNCLEEARAPLTARIVHQILNSHPPSAIGAKPSDAIYVLQLMELWIRTFMPSTYTCRPPQQSLTVTAEPEKPMFRSSQTVPTLVFAAAALVIHRCRLRTSRYLHH